MAGLARICRGETLTVIHNEKARLCAKNVMVRSVKSFMGPEELDFDALERFWRAYMFRDWGSINKGDILLLDPLWRKLGQQPEAFTFVRRFFSVSLHLILRLQVRNVLNLLKIVLFLCVKQYSDK